LLYNYNKKKWCTPGVDGEWGQKEKLIKKKIVFINFISKNVK
jgi:hypothetical protein